LVTVKLDKERHLKLALRGMVAFEELTGKNLLNGVDFTQMTMQEVAGLMWACLLHEDKELTFDVFLDIVNLNDIPTLSDAVARCVTESFPESKGKKRPLVAKPPSG